MPSSPTSSTRAPGISAARVAAVTSDEVITSSARQGMPMPFNRLATLSGGVVELLVRKTNGTPAARKAAMKAAAPGCTTLPR